MNGGFGLVRPSQQEGTVAMTNTTAVDISDLSKAEVLAALFNASSPAGMGFLQAANGPKVMDITHAQRLIDDLEGSPQGVYFDYLYGRPLKLDLRVSYSFEPWGFDRDNGGDGTAQKVIDRLRETHNVNPSESAEASGNLRKERREKSPNEAALGDLLELLAPGHDQAVRQRIQDDGISVPSGLSARQHLDWSSDTALRYFDNGDPSLAVDVFLRLVAEHPGTAYIVDSPLTPMLMADGVRGGRARLEYMMKGFAA